MNIKTLSKSYQVKKLEDTDVLAVYELCKRNPQYYKHCPPAVSEESIKADMQALPPGKTSEDKYYIGFYDDKKLLAVMDLIVKYPNDLTAFIGFFMMDADEQGKGTGSQIISELCGALKEEFTRVRLGYVKGNGQSENFWMKNLFEKTGVESKTDHYDVVMMQRTL